MARPTLILSNGRLVMSNGALAISRECCCTGDPPPPPPYEPGLETCCTAEDERGTWPDDWPEELLFTISGSCCGSLNHTWRIAKGGGFQPLYSSAFFPTYVVTGCGGMFGFIGTAVGVWCLAGSWRLSFTGGPTIQDPTVPCKHQVGGWVYDQPSLIRCNPLYLVGAGRTIAGDDCENVIGFRCAGPFRYTITEPPP